MAQDEKTKLRLEIAHVLFIDVVGYSQLSINEQHAAVDELTQVVRGTGEFKKADASQHLIKIATGDGMALVFYSTPEAPVRCAIEVTRALKDNPRLRLRMGIHSGPVSGVIDVTERTNLAGAGLNLAQRVMNCGDTGHVLLSKHVAEDLAEFEEWRPLLHDLGACEVKHGTEVSIANLYGSDFGNPELPATFRLIKKRSGRRRNLVVAAALIAGAAIIAVGVWFSRARMGSSLSAPEKSIAVLPFENLSRDPENAYFAEGMQDEILARLSKIADLKVISRTSTQKYKSAPDNLREIAKQLGVANIVEGSVQKVADQVRVDVQLINALNDTHLWGDIYDRKLTDIFRVENDIATTIAETLQAKLTGSEKRAINARPTDNAVAYQDYLKGRYFWNKRTGNDFKTAISYFERAVQEDPRFALAYAGLADTYVLLPAFTWAAPQDSMPKAKAAAQKALEFDDTLAEAHTPLAMVLRAYDFDYTQAIVEFKRAIDLNPNYAPAHYWFGAHVLSALGRFDEAIAEVRQAIELDPLSLVANVDLGATYIYARRFDDAIDVLHRAIELDDNFYYAHSELGIALECKGAIDEAIAEYEKARKLSTDPLLLGLLGHAYAVRGRQDDALGLLGQLKDESAHRYVPAFTVAITYLGLGDKDQALRWLEKGFSDRDGWNIGLIKVDPLLDSLRGDPRFEALAKSGWPKVDCLALDAGRLLENRLLTDENGLRSRAGEKAPRFDSESVCRV
jgi:TolB-like protein/Tfp pilus assembly protein PilF/class 3 adenylate cyclase